MKNKKNINKSKLPFFLASVLIGFLIVFGLTEGVLAQTGLSVGAGNNNLILEAGENIYYGVSHHTSSPTAGLILLQTYNGGESFTDRFKVESSGNIIGSGKMALGGAAIDSNYALNITGNVNSSGFCIAGDCRLSWGAITGTSFWNQLGSNLYASSTTWNVGIGTAEPALKAEIKGTQGYPATSGTTQTGVLRLSGLGTPILDFGIADASPWGAWIQATRSSDLSTTYPLLLNPNGGNVGIGTNNPSSQLTVVGNTRLNGSLYIYGNVNSYPASVAYTNSDTSWHGIFNSAYKSRGSLSSPTALDSNDAIMYYDQWGYDGYGYSRGAQFRSFVDGIVSEGIVPVGWEWLTKNSAGVYSSKLRIGSSGLITINQNLIVSGTGNTTIAGNVGIGTTTPTARLSIVTPDTYSILAGMQRIGNVADPSINTDAATKGYVDSTIGTVAPGGASSTWSILGNNIYNNNFGNVGIGISEPTEKLDVNGIARIRTLANAIGDILTVSASGVIQKRTAAETRFDIGAAKEINSLYYVEGNTSGTAGTWTGSIDGVSAYYDGLSVAYKIGVAGASPTTLNINGLGAVVARRNTGNLTTHLPVGTVAVFTYTTISGTPYWVWADYDSTQSYDMRWINIAIAGDQVTRYKYVMEGVDGKFYPLTLGDTTAGTKTVSTAAFKLGGHILDYSYTGTIAANAQLSAYSLYSQRYSNGTTAPYTFNQSSGFTAGMPVYLKGTIQSDGSFKLDNTTATSWLTQTLPTTEDGFVYIHIGFMHNTTTAFTLTLEHSIYEFRNGKIRLYEAFAGSGNSNYLTKWTGSNSFGTSQIFNNGTNVGIGTTTPIAKLHITNPINNYTVNVGGYRIGSLMDPELDSDAATKGYVDSAAQGVTTPSENGDFGYWNLFNGVISNRNGISSSVGVNTGGTSISGVSFAVAQGQAGSGSVRVDSGELNRIKGCSSTNFQNSFKVGDTIRPSGQNTATITWISSTTQEMLVTPSYGSSFSCTTYNLTSVPVGGAARFVVKGSGQVGIGVLDPQASLHVSSAATNASSSYAIIVGDASSSIAFAVDREGKVKIGSSSSEELLNIGGGKIFIGSSASTTPVENRLYNVEGSLYWGNTIIGSASSNPWRLVDNTISASSSEWKLAIGSSTAALEAFHLSGRLFLGNTEAPTETANRLYSTAGKLYWDGKPVGADATTTWALSGNNLYSSSTAWNVAIGLADAGIYKLNVLGNSYFNGTINSTGAISTTGAFLANIGAATTPAFSFNGNLNTGMFSPAANQIAFSTSGTARLTITTAQFTGTLPWRGPAGSAGAPAFSFSADTNTGMYGGSDILNFATAGLHRMTINEAGRIGIGTTTPSTSSRVQISSTDTYELLLSGGKLGGLGEPTALTDAATKDYVDNAVGTSAYLPLAGTGAGFMTGDIDMGGKNISNLDTITANKLNVNVIDPLYTIGGVSYATFGVSFAGGLKEEYSGKVDIKKKNTKGEYESVIDFRKLTIGSDLWLWYQVVDFSKDNVEVVSTPYGKFAAVYYVIENDKLIFRSDKQVEISYRLIGRRFDWRDWPTKTSDQSVKGIELKIKK